MLTTTLLWQSVEADCLAAIESSGLAAITGPGGVSTTITVKSTGGSPLQGVNVWITSDLAGSNIVAGKAVTGPDGKVTFMLPTNTPSQPQWFVWRQFLGETFSNPQAIVIAG